MSATSRDIDESMARSDPEGPGSQLRDARNRANYSLEDVSTELHLNADTVRALEEDRFEGLPAPAFVRGYIRSYARLLNLPPGPILEAYDQKGFTPPNIVPDITQQPQAKSTDVPVRLATYLVAAGLVVMVVMWWQTRESAQIVVDDVIDVAEAPPAPKAPEPMAPVETTTVSTALEPPAIDAAEASDMIGPTASESPSGFSPLPEVIAATTEYAPVPTEPAPEAQSAEPPAVAIFTPQPEAVEPVPAAAEIETPQAPVEPESAPAPAQSNVPENRLDLAFERESWVEVYDGKGDRLVYQLAIDGERMTLDAVPPVRVVLGYAEGAKVTFNGRDLDVTPHMQRGMARFVVAADGTVRTLTTSSNTSSAPSSAAAEPELQPQN